MPRTDAVRIRGISGPICPQRGREGERLQTQFIHLNILSGEIKRKERKEGTSRWNRFHFVSFYSFYPERMYFGNKKIFEASSDCSGLTTRHGRVELRNPRASVRSKVEDKSSKSKDSAIRNELGNTERKNCDTCRFQIPFAAITALV